MKNCKNNSNASVCNEIFWKNIELSVKIRVKLKNGWRPQIHGGVIVQAISSTEVCKTITGFYFLIQLFD